MTREKSSEKIFELENKYKYTASAASFADSLLYPSSFIHFTGQRKYISLSIGRFYIIFLAALRDEQNIMLLNPAQFEIFGERNYFHNWKS